LHIKRPDGRGNRKDIRHRKPMPLIPRGSLQGQMEEKIQGNWLNPGSPGEQPLNWKLHANKIFIPLHK